MHAMRELLAVGLGFALAMFLMQSVERIPPVDSGPNCNLVRC
jgi:hypothetical protein